MTIYPLASGHQVQFTLSIGKACESSLTMILHIAYLTLVIPIGYILDHIYANLLDQMLFDQPAEHQGDSDQDRAMNAREALR